MERSGGERQKSGRKEMRRGVKMMTQDRSERGVERKRGEVG